MRLLVTGAAGMLGSDVVAAARASGHEVVALARADLDIADPAAVARAIADHAPDAVVNCAAWTDVDGAEEHEAAATEVNGTAAGVLAAHAPYVVHVSSDYVFAGDATEPYVESDATGPIGAYGRSKLAGEQAVAAQGDQHAIVRASWLFGPHGRNFVDTMLRLAADRDEVKVVDDQIGCPTYTGHLATALIDIAQRRLGGVLHVAGGGRCSWHDLAAAAFARTGTQVTLHPCTTAEFPRPAPRPAYSVLASERDDAPRLPHWEEGLAAHLAARPQEVAAP
jgi:dTDP-4-dehydrorhamnose reductase